MQARTQTHIVHILSGNVLKQLKRAFIYKKRLHP